MINKNFFLLGILLLSARLSAQNEIDALRYSQIQLGGTTRSLSMGNAFGALGGDFSVLSTNPAGIAIYRKSEVMGTIGFFNNSTSATHFGNKVNDSKYNLNISNIGWIANLNSNSSGWTNTCFGIGYNRINNFNKRFTFQGTNDNSSLLDVFLDQLNANGGIDAANIGDNPDFTFGTNLAWQTFLLDTAGGATNYYSALPVYGELQQGSVISNGNMGETVISFGSTYEYKLYVGGSIGIESVNYFEESNYQEFAPEGDTNIYLTSFDLKDKLHTSGVGYNFKFGLIFKPNDYFRLGAAIHSPTFFNLSDKYSSYMTSDFKGGEHYEYSSPTGAFDYQLITPYRAIGSIAIILGQIGLLSADYEFIDYSSARLQSDSYDFIKETNQINLKYTATSNVRAGTEWRFDPFRIRAGYTYFGNSYASLVDNDNSKQAFSAGLGFRDKEYYIDLGYIYTMNSEKYFIYNPDYVDATNLNSNTHNFLLTVGFRY